MATKVVLDVFGPRVIPGGIEESACFVGEVMLQAELEMNMTILHPGRSTWNMKMDLWKTVFLYIPVVFRFHVNLSGVEPGWRKHEASGSLPMLIYNFGVPSAAGRKPAGHNRCLIL
ncbi:unnamed protein product [Durusdinium trenchii]|uniref:Uncharacterized protein n=1 Tax=Durusdinium trenchii TaxID=1381693 RepID=A0ABP0P5I8_9DINO